MPVMPLTPVIPVMALMLNPCLLEAVPLRFLGDSGDSGDSGVVFR